MQKLKSTASLSKLSFPGRIFPPRLAHGLDKVLFMKGPITMQELALDIKIPSIKEFKFEKLADFVPCSQDGILLETGKKHGLTYASSTSSITSMIFQFYRLISGSRQTQLILDSFEGMSSKFTAQSRKPVSTVLGYHDGIYTLHKPSDGSSTILSELGLVLEKLLVTEKDEMQQFMQGKTPKEESAYHYSKIGKFILRAQLDAYDPNLPRQTFDLKTRATHPIRMDVENYYNHYDYQITSDIGRWFSFEREYYDLLRGALMKYSLQARIGNMDGIFLCYHNVESIFGFEYLPLEKIDNDLFGGTIFAEKAFENCFNLMEICLDRITKDHPEQDIQLFIEVQSKKMRIFVETAKGNALYCLRVSSKVNGKKVKQPWIDDGKDEWQISYSFEKEEFESHLFEDVKLRCMDVSTEKSINSRRIYSSLLRRRLRY